MRKRFLFSLIAAVVGALAPDAVADDAAPRVVELVAPRDGATLHTLPAAQRAVLAGATQAARRDIASGETGPWRANAPLVLTWRALHGTKGPWKIRIGTDPTLAKGRNWYIRSRDICPDYSGIYRYEVPRPNLEPGRRYWWRVWGQARCGKWECGSTVRPGGCSCGLTGPAPASQTWSFAMADAAPRWIDLEGRTGNVRDLGGWRTEDGRRVRRGLLFRGEAFNDNSANAEEPGARRLTLEDADFLVRTLGIRTELDLRTRFELATMDASPLGPSVRYVHRSSLAYPEIFTPDGMKAMAENFRLLCDRTNLPAYFHCIAGADRTGALAYVLNGVLGVAREDLARDWECTFYPAVPDVVKENFGPVDIDGTYWRSLSFFDRGFARYAKEGDALKDRIAAYLVACGVTEAEIARFRSIMLDPAEE